MDYTVDKLSTEDLIGCGNRHIAAGPSSRGVASDIQIRGLEGDKNQPEIRSGVVSRISSTVPFRYGQNPRNADMLLDKLDGYNSANYSQNLSQARKEEQAQSASSFYDNKQKPYGSQFSYSFGEDGLDSTLKRCIESTPLYSESDLRSANWLGMRNKLIIPQKGYTTKPEHPGSFPESVDTKDDFHSGISFGSDFKYARATHNKQVLCPDPASQLKNPATNSSHLNPDFPFPAVNCREALPFSSTPESWNLLSPENYHRQPESFVSNNVNAESRSKPLGRFGSEVPARPTQQLPENNNLHSAVAQPSGEKVTKLEVCDNQNKTKNLVDENDSESTIDNEDFKVKMDDVKTKDDNKRTTARYAREKSSNVNKKKAVKNMIVDVPVPFLTGNKRFQCEICKKSWKFKKGFNKHMKTHSRKFSCTLCKCDFINKLQLNKHLQTHADSKLLDEATTSLSEADVKQDHCSARAYPCPECSYKAKQKKDLTKHMKVHTTAKIHKCQLCDFSSKRRYSLHRHLKAVHSITKMYECTVCDFKVDTLDRFKVHIAEHASSPATPGSTCDSVLKERANLAEQLLTFSLSQKTKCKKCEEIYLTSVESMHHLFSHKRAPISLDEMYRGFGLGESSSLSNKDSSRLMMEASTDDVKMAQMSTIVTRLADVTKTLNLLGDVSKRASELAEISNLASELVVIAEIMLPSYKNLFSTRRKTRSSSGTRNMLDDSSFMEDDFEFSSVLDVDPATVKEECVDKLYTSAADINMQIQVDFNGEAISCVQKDYFEHGAGDNKKGKHLRCSLCNLVFTDTCGLKRHLLVHIDARPWTCKKCGQSFRRKEHLKKHMVTHSADRPFVCEECHYGAKTEERLKIHISCCHARSKQFGCQFCSYSGRTSYDLSQHMKRHKPQNCSQCTFLCYSKAEIRKHLSTHSSFDCGVCQFTTTDRVEYARHEKKHAMTQYLCCELCGYSCDTLRKFKYHKLRHENKTPFECPDCDYKCSSRASYDCHRLKHAGLKPFLCSFCGSSFIKSSHLNQHMLIHKDEKSFKCAVCGYSCRTKHNMKEHEMTHSGEKPYACKFCNFSSRRKKALLLHMTKHEGH